MTQSQISDVMTLIHETMCKIGSFCHSVWTSDSSVVKVNRVMLQFRWEHLQCPKTSGKVLAAFWYEFLS
jgi:hypothetical protein